MSNSKRPTSNATPEANASDTSAKNAEGGIRGHIREVTVNGRVCTTMVEPRMTLLDALREEPALTGTKKGCDRDECGTCTVHVDGRRGLSCMTLAAMQEGKRITTTEGVEREGQLHPLHAASIRADHFGRGYDRRDESGRAELRHRRPHEALSWRIYREDRSASR